MGNTQTYDFKENRVLSIDMGMVKYHCIRKKVSQNEINDSIWKPDWSVLVYPVIKLAQLGDHQLGDAAQLGDH